MGDLLNQWAVAKGGFAALKGKGIIPDKELDVIIKSPGVEKSLTAAEKAIANGDKKGLKNAFQVYEKAVELSWTAVDVTLRKLKQNYGQESTAYTDFGQPAVQLQMIKQQIHNDLMQELNKLLRTGSDTERAELKPTSYTADWKAAKKTFEGVTGKKKPSAKFLGLFHRSGVESALEALDKATKEDKPKDVLAAAAKVEKAASEYKKTLTAGAKDDDSDYSKELKALSDNLDTILGRVRITVKQAGG